MKEGELYGGGRLCGKLNKQNEAEGGGDNKQKNEKEKRQNGGQGGHHTFNFLLSPILLTNTFSVALFFVVLSRTAGD